MRTRILAAVVAALALSPVAVLAQSEKKPAPSGGVRIEAQGDDSSSEGAGGETEGAEVVDQADQARPAEGGKTSAPGEVHTVTKGDTLWDLSQRYLGSPWYWPTGQSGDQQERRPGCSEHSYLLLPVMITQLQVGSSL